MSAHTKYNSDYAGKPFNYDERQKFSEFSESERADALNQRAELIRRTREALSPIYDDQQISE